MSELALGLATNPLPWLLAAALTAIVFLFREVSAAKKELIDSVVKSEASHRETLMKVIPIAEKLADLTEILEKKL
jgi:hypothetical protein